jgi:hypothetical protein
MEDHCVRRVASLVLRLISISAPAVGIASNVIVEEVVHVNVAATPFTVAVTSLLVR